ncbi:MAG: hypothetical protein HQK78_17760 [Desulfobacterales bacterium]|nr:hypothetical protein [Desulfobacterales bacterium]
MNELVKKSLMIKANSLNRLLADLLILFNYVNLSEFKDISLIPLDIDDENLGEKFKDIIPSSKEAKEHITKFYEDIKHLVPALNPSEAISIEALYQKISYGKELDLDIDNPKIISSMIAYSYSLYKIIIKSISSDEIKQKDLSKIEMLTQLIIETGREVIGYHSALYKDTGRSDKIKKCPICSKWFIAKDIKRKICYGKKCEKERDRKEKREQRKRNPDKYRTKYISSKVS